jgi:hypothetical protein
MSADLGLMLLEPAEVAVVQRYGARAMQMLSEIDAAGPVATPVDAHGRNALAVEAACALRDLEALRKRAVVPLDEQRKVIQATFAAVSEPLERCKRTLQAQLGAWQAAENARIRREQDEARRVREEAQRAEEAAKAAILTAAEAEVDEVVATANAAQDARIKAEFAEALVPPEIHGLRATGGGSTHSRRAWTFEVIVTSEVPREYCEPSDKLIRAAITAGAREIRGVRIYEQTRGVTRA